MVFANFTSCNNYVFIVFVIVVAVYVATSLLNKDEYNSKKL